VGRRLVEEHLLEPARYHAPVGVPSVAMDEPSFQPGFHLFRCWRGPSWINVAWLLVPPMRALGYEAEAVRIVDSLVGAVERHGFREYYNPLDGDGLAARRFGWSTLLVDLLAERRAANGDGAQPAYRPPDLPSIDERSTHVAAPAERVWDALVATLPTVLAVRGAAPVARVLGCDADSQSGSPERPGSTLPGFEVAHAEPPSLLVLAGQHHFARYEVEFRVEALGAGRSRLNASTLAGFPRAHGRAWQLAFVRTGGYSAAVGALLGAVRRRAERRRV
jgi:hypothetical protein